MDMETLKARIALDHYFFVVRRVFRGTAYVSSLELTNDDLREVVIHASAIHNLVSPESIAPFYKQELAKTKNPNPTRDEKIVIWEIAAKSIVREYAVENGLEPKIHREIVEGVVTVGAHLRRHSEQTQIPDTAFELDENILVADPESNEKYNLRQVCPAPQLARQWYQAAREVIDYIPVKRTHHPVVGFVNRLRRR